MLAFIGVVLLGTAMVVFRWSLRRGKYRRYPYELFFFVGTSLAAGAASVALGPSWWNVSLAVLEAAALGMLTWYIVLGARFRRESVSVVPGERFPDFVLRDSLGAPFDSTTLAGKTALFLFYRGPW